MVSSTNNEKASLRESSVFFALQGVNENESENIRICKALKRADIITVEELLECSEEFIISLRGIGYSRAATIVKAIENLYR